MVALTERPLAEAVHPRRWYRSYGLQVVLAVGLFGAAVLVATAYDLPIRDPDDSIVGPVYIRLPLVAVICFLIDVLWWTLRRAGLRGWRSTVPAVVRERWPVEHVRLVLIGMGSWYLAYVGFRNLKSYVPFVRPHMMDDTLLRIDRTMAFGHDPARLLHDLLGTGATAHLMSFTYVAWIVFLSLSLLVALFWTRNINTACWYVTGVAVNWVLGVSVYYLVPSVGPIYARPSLFADLPETEVTHIAQSWLADRAAMLADPFGTDTLQTVAAFASLHVAVMVTASLIASMVSLQPVFVRWGLWLFLCLNIVATVYLGWHYVLDVFGGIAIGVGSVWIAAYGTGNAHRLVSRRHAPGGWWIGRVWTLVLLFAAVTVAGSYAFGVPVRDPHGAWLRTRLAISLGLFMLLIVVDAAMRASRRGWSVTGIVEELRRRWTPGRLALASSGLLAYHLVYFCYHNLKSWNVFRRPRDDMLQQWDRLLFLGHSPAVLLHHLLGEGVAPYVLMVVYVSFSTLVSVSVVAALVFTDRIRQGYVFLASALWVWILGVGSYYLVPSLGPFSSDPQEFSGLPHTMIQDTQTRYLAQRAHVLAQAPDATAQIGAFASLHVGVVCLILLMARYYCLRRTTQAMTVYLAGTMLATVYLGWHFAVDDLGGLAIAFLAMVLGRSMINANQSARSSEEGTCDPPCAPRPRGRSSLFHSPWRPTRSSADVGSDPRGRRFSSPAISATGWPGATGSRERADRQACRRGCPTGSSPPGPTP
jgi:hypothetical protein